MAHFKKAAAVHRYALRNRLEKHIADARIPCTQLILIEKRNHLFYQQQWLKVQVIRVHTQTAVIVYVLLS